MARRSFTVGCLAGLVPAGDDAFHTFEGYLGERRPRPGEQGGTVGG